MKVIREIERIIQIKRREFLPQLEIRVQVEELDIKDFIEVCKYFGEKGWDVDAEKETKELKLTPRCLNI